MKKIEHTLELMMFNSRWLLAPFYLGLIISIALILIKFTQELIHIIAHVFSATESELILAVLTLVDMALVANLFIIIIFSGYENFVSKIHTDGHQDRPDWMGKVDFSGLKVKLIGSIVAISAIELLKAFVKVEAMSNQELAWKVGIHMALVVSGVLFAVMDRVAESTHQKVNESKNENGGH